MTAPALKYYALVPLALLCGLYIFKAIDFPAHDFANYYFGAKFLADAKFDTLSYYPYEFNKAIADLGYRHIFASYAPNTPFLALAFLPFTLFGVVVAKCILNCLSAGLFLYSLKRLSDHYQIGAQYLFLVPVLFFVPIKNDLLFGQVYLLLFFLLAESWIAYEKKQWWKSSVLLGLAILLKVFPVLLVLVFICRRQFRPFTYTVACCAVLLSLSIVVSGIDVWSFYFKTVLAKAANGEISEAYVANYQSVFMFFKQLLVFDETQNPSVFFNSPVLFKALMLAFKVALLVLGWYFTKRANNALFVISFWLLAMVLSSPYGSTYTLVLLVLPFFSLVKSPLGIEKKMIALGLLFFICNVTPMLTSTLNFPFSFLRLFALLLLFVLFFSWLWYCINSKILIAAVTLSIAAVLLLSNAAPQKTAYALAKNSPILIYDYHISGNALTYFYWDERGKNAQTVAFSAQQQMPCEIMDNEVYYNGKRLTTDNGAKRKAIAIDRKFIVYLSDADRGIGFYTLRKINLR